MYMCIYGIRCFKLLIKFYSCLWYYTLTYGGAGITENIIVLKFIACNIQCKGMKLNSKSFDSFPVVKVKICTGWFGQCKKKLEKNKNNFNSPVDQIWLLLLFGELIKLFKRKNYICCYMYGKWVKKEMFNILYHSL